MKKHLSMILAVLLLLSSGLTNILPVHAVVAPTLTPVTVSLTPEADTRLKPGSGNSGLDYSMDTYFTTQNERTSLVRFDLSQIPTDAEITEATLKIYCTGTSERTSQVDIRRVTRDWVEGTGNYEQKGTDGATWTTTDGTALWDAPGGDLDDTVYDTQTIVPKDWNTWNITDLVSEWVSGTYDNQGLAVIENPASIHAYSYFSTKDSTRKPVLTLTYLEAAQNTADFTVSAEAGTAPFQVTFTEDTAPEAASWEWDFNNDGTVDATEASPDYTYEAPGVYTVSLKVTFPDGTERTVMKENLVTVTAPQPATLDFDASKTEGEAPLTVTFTEISAPQATAWEWDFNDDGTVDATTKAPSFKYTTPGDHSVSLKATFPDGTVKSLRKEAFISVTAPSGTTLLLNPVADTRLKPGAGNSGLDYSMDTYFTTKNERTSLVRFDLSALPADAVITNATLKIYCTGTSQNKSIVDIRRVTAPWVEGTGKYDMKGTDGATWTTTDGTTLWAAPGGDMAARIYSSQVIVPKAWNTWNITDLVSEWASGASPNHGLAVIESPTAIHAFSYFRTKDSSDKPVLEITYQGGTAPVPNTLDFSPSVTTGISPLTVAFSESSTPQATAWQWDFDSNGTIDSTVKAPSFTYAAPGTYAVTLKATFPDGSEKVVKRDALITVTAPVPNTLDFTPSVTSGNAPLTVTFAGSASPQAAAWQWDFDSNGTIDSTLQAPSFTYATPGTYAVTLKATYPDGTVKTLKKDALITVSGSTTGRVFEVGVDKPYKRIIDVDTANLLPGDTVYIHAKPDNSPYKEKFFVRGKGTAEMPIRIVGVPNASGQLPIIDGNGAICRKGNAFWNEDRAVIMFGQKNNGVVPEYFSIENLKITGGKAQNPYTSQTGGQWMYNWNAAGIWIAAGDNVKLYKCEIYGNENGIFSSSCRQFTIDSCYVHDNGMQAGSSQEHNFYLNGGPDSKAIIEHCRIGEQLNDGQQFKSRVETLIFRYNWVEGGKNSQLDLVEEADNGVSNAWVYGNVIIKPTVCNNGRIIHFGGDLANATRTGTLYFFNNTVINKAARSVNIFQINEPGANVIAGNNIFYNASASALNLYDTAYMQGTLTGSNNWATDTIVNLSKLQNTLTGKNPGFVNAANSDFSLLSTSPAINTGLAPLPAGIQLLEHYVKHQSFTARPANGPLDIGAFEF